MQNLMRRATTTKHAGPSPFGVAQPSPRRHRHHPQQCLVAAGGTRRRRALQCRAFNLLEALGKVKEKIEWEMNYENWAPRGARAYRLRELPADVLQRDADKRDDDEDEPAFTPRLSALQAAVAQGADGALSGEELRQLCVVKYGVAYDMAIKAVEVNKGGMDRFVALNLYAQTLGQKSFPYTEEVYIEKLDAVALMLSAWQQADYVRTWFRQPAAPRGGLPSRPRVDTAVTLRLNNSPTWDAAAAEEWFTT